MQRLEVSGAVRSIYGPLGVKRLKRGTRSDGHVVGLYLISTAGGWSPIMRIAEHIFHTL